MSCVTVYSSTALRGALPWHIHILHLSESKMHDVQLVALSHDLQILASLDSFEIMKMLLAMRLTQQNKCREVRVSMDAMA